MERFELDVLGYTVILDECDRHFVSTIGISIVHRDDLHHVCINTQPYYKQYLHRVLLGLTNPNDIVDHIDGNGLNNTRANLRVTTKAGNALNMRVNKNKKSGLPKGVYKERDGYKAQIKYNHINRYLGHFTSIEKAEARYKQELEIYWARFTKGDIIK